MDFQDQIEKLASKISSKAANLHRPMVVALDGASGAGKSTVASLLTDELDAAVIALDDFFAADIPDSRWDEFAVEEKRRKVFQWHRLRRECIRPLLQGRPARWRAFDFQSGMRSDGTYGMENVLKARDPAAVIIVEGAYSAGPELADLVDFAVLVRAPQQTRHARLTERDGETSSQAWLRRWQAVEEFYFNNLRPETSFDFVLAWI